MKHKMINVMESIVVLVKDWALFCSRIDIRKSVWHPMIVYHMLTL